MNRNLFGIGAVIGAGAAMMSADALAKVAVVETTLGQTIAGRGLVACLILTAAGLAQGQIRWHRAVLSAPVVVRILAEVGAGISMVGALGFMPIANATAILQFIPLVTTMAAAVLFAENVGWRRWAAGIAGFLGVLLVLQPGAAGFTWWSLLAVSAMLCMSTRDLATSRIDRTLPTLLVGALSAAAVSIAGCGLATLTGWAPMTSRGLAFTVAAGVALAAGFICLVVGMRNAEMSAVAPFRYFTLLWALLMGYFAWGEVPNSLAWAGIGIVVAAGLYAFGRERALARQRHMEFART
ncbi:MAG: DMT family transporter [Hyphomicrobiaceae bacterium]